MATHLLTCTEPSYTFYALIYHIQSISMSWQPDLKSQICLHLSVSTWTILVWSTVIFLVNDSHHVLNGPCFHSCPSILNLSSSPGVISLKYKLPVVVQRIKTKFCTIAYKPSIIRLLTILYSHHFSPFPSLFILQPLWPSLCSSNSPKLAPTWECGSAYSSAGCQILTASATSFHSAHGEHRYLTSMLLPWPPCWNQSLLLFYCFISLIIIDNYLVSLKKKNLLSLFCY